MGGRRAKRILALGAALAVVAPAAAGGTGPIDVGIPGPLEVDLRASFTPKMLAAKEQTPVALHTTAKIRMEDGSQPPALQGYQLQIDRRMRFDRDKVPPCSGGVQSRVRGQVPEGCRDSIVGRGSMKVDVRFPEAAPFVVSGEGVVYWARSDQGRPAFYFQANFPAPITQEVIVTLELKRVEGRYGLEAVGTVPKIAGGAGSALNLDLRFRKGIFTAACPPRGPLQIGQQARFADKTQYGTTMVITCTSPR
jgi:hypothetical protein